MFSAKIITAIQILHELEPLKDKKVGSSCRKCVVSKKELAERSYTSTFVIKQVLDEMLKAKWVDRNHRGYFVLIEIQELTLYDIYYLFHGGIPIGESYCCDNSYRYNKQLENLSIVESEIIESLTLKFKSHKFADIKVVI